MLTKDDIRQLLKFHFRRLQVLKKQRASFGSLHTPAHILIEIEDTEAEIEKLKTALKVVEDYKSNVAQQGKTPRTISRPSIQTINMEQRSWCVLSIEDDPGWQKRLTRILRELNCIVFTADSYEHALALLADISFDLVTIDLNLDKSTQYADGLELVPQIHKLVGPKLPIIVITGTGNLDDQRRAFKDLNVFDFIQKAKLDIGEFKGIVMEAMSTGEALGSY